MSPKDSKIHKCFYFALWLIAIFGLSSCGWSPNHLPHKIENKKTLITSFPHILTITRVRIGK
jgi:hypothetical protein